MANGVDPEEKDAVKAFVRDLYEGGGWKRRVDFARAADVSELSLNEWMSPKGSAPNAANLLRLIRAVPAYDRALVMVDLTGREGALTNVARRLAEGERVDPADVARAAQGLRDVAALLEQAAAALEVRSQQAGEP